MVLESALVALAGTNANGRLHRAHENLSVADVAGLGSSDDDIGDLARQVVGHYHLDFYLRQEVHRVLAASVKLGVALLPPEPAHLGHRHADDADAGERLLDVVQLERLDDRFDFFHAGPPRSRPGAMPMPKPPSAENPRSREDFARAGQTAPTRDMPSE